LSVIERFDTVLPKKLKEIKTAFEEIKDFCRIFKSRYKSYRRSRMSSIEDRGSTIILRDLLDTDSPNNSA